MYYDQEFPTMFVAYAFWYLHPAYIRSIIMAILIRCFLGDLMDEIEIDEYFIDFFW